MGWEIKLSKYYSEYNNGNHAKDSSLKEQIGVVVFQSVWTLASKIMNEVGLGLWLTIICLMTQAYSMW